MAAKTKTRAKFGYLNYESMIKKIANKELDAYDVNFAPDTKECYIVTPDLEAWAIKSRVYTFDNVDLAIESLNSNTDTYAGQIVSIRFDEKYKAYIVNQDVQGYTVTPLSLYEEEIDYNTLGNRPIVNLVGTLDNPISVETLDNGIYMVKGQYVIPGIDTVFLSASNILFIVEEDESSMHIKKITSHEMTDYVVTEEGTTSDIVITSEYLNKQGFATTAYVDNKILALDFITREEVSVYVENVIHESFVNVIDERIDEKLAESEADNSAIDNLF